MQILLSIGLLLISYVIGSIPFGLLLVWVKNGKDIRQIESGRTGGTNAMRAAGFWAGAGTTVLDFFKSAITVWLARLLLPGNIWLEVLAPVAAVIGHNYSVFLIARGEKWLIKFRGGAGGAPTAGGAFGIWPPSILIIFPVGLLVLFGIGYASLSTLSIAFMATVVFAYRAWIGASPWQYTLYGIITFMLLVWALKPNIRRLFNGNERVVGWRAKRIRSDQ